MHDLKEIRVNTKAFDDGLKKRGLAAKSKEILHLDAERRIQITLAEEARSKQKKLSKEFNIANKDSNTSKILELKSAILESKKIISQAEDKLKILDTQLEELLLFIPNIPDGECPKGSNEKDNVEMIKWGDIRQFQFQPKEHFDIPAATGLDFESSSKVSGSRFVILKGSMAKLQRALSQFMLDTHVEEHGLNEVWVPVLVNPSSMIGTGNLPKFAEDSYQTTDGKWLIPTAEVPLTNTASQTVFAGSDLPQRLVAHSQCFRSEAGSAGRDTKGMLRQHQFEKVEMVTICKPENSESELKRMLNCAQKILQKLNLPYRTVILCTGDMGFSSQKTFDIEVWLPGQKQYREISSCSNCGSFQARRMLARYKENSAAKPSFVNTLNGSGLAIGRCLIAVLENYQQEDGSVIIPEVLKKYMNNNSRISPEGHMEN